MGSSPSTSGDQNNNNTDDKKKQMQISHKGNGLYKPYSEFPDIHRMHQAQSEFGESTYSIPNDENGIPTPFPTLKPRHQIYEQYDFSNIDSHAEKAPQSLLRDVSRLVSYFCEEAKDDIEKIRAIFAWISSRDQSNTLPELKNGMPKADTPLAYLLDIMISAKTFQYNPLFALLCKEAGIPHIMVKGHIKASAKELGDAPSSQGTYYMVFVNGNWRFIHPHWGSCYVRSIRSQSDWQLVEGVAGNKSGLASIVSPDILAFDREDFWFFIDPEVMAHFFLSNQAEHQLLARPIKQEEYRQMARLYSPFFLGELKSINPAKCHLDVEESVVIEIGLSDDDNMHYDYGIFKRAIDPDWKHTKEFRRLVFMERLGDKLRIRFDMPHIGVFKFEVSARKHLSAPSGQTLCEYLIDNKMPNFSCRPNPKNELNEWGVGPNTKQLGLEPETEGGAIEAQQGKAVVVFRQTKTEDPALFSYRLEDERGRSEELKDYIRNAKYVDKSSVIIKTPHPGKYVLKVQGKGPNERNLKDLSNYLVVSDRGVADDTPFPKALRGQIGLLGNQNPPMLEPISHKDPIIEYITEGQIEITMKESGNLDIKPSLIIDDQNKEQYVYHYKTGDKRVFILNLPSAGSFSFMIKAKEDGSNDVYQPVYNYILTSNGPKPNCKPFPQILPSWRSDFIITEPRDGLLYQNTRQTFRFRIPGAEKVLLIRGQEKINLTQDQDSSNTEENDTNVDTNGDIWHAELETGSKADDIILVVKMKADENSKELLKYKIMSKEEEEATLKGQKEAELKADERNKKIQQKAAIEEREAEMRKKTRDKKVKAEQEDFKKNKNKYFEKQRKLEEEAMKKESNLFDMKEFKGREEKKDQDKWKDLQNKITGELRIEQLREAIRSKNKDRLQAAINQAVNNGVNDDNELLNKAQKELEIAILKEELRTAMNKKDPSEITDAMTKIFSNNYHHSRLQQDVAEATKLLDRLMKIMDMKVDHLEMNSALFAELRRYNQPPDVIHSVIQAALLLFEKDEESTESWKTCQQHLTPTGPKSMNRKILDFEPSSVHPEVAARSREILNQYELDKVQEVSPAAATIYVWALGATESLVPEDSNIVPASINRQCELFGYPKKSPTSSYDFRFSK